MDTFKAQQALVYFSKDAVPDDDDLTTTSEPDNDPNSDGSDRPGSGDDEMTTNEPGHDIDQNPQQSDGDDITQQPTDDKNSQQSDGDDHTPEQSNGDQMTTNEPAPADSNAQSTPPPGTDRFADSNRHSESISEPSRLRDLFYGSIATASRP